MQTQCEHTAADLGAIAMSFLAAAGTLALLFLFMFCEPQPAYASQKKIEEQPMVTTPISNEPRGSLGNQPQINAFECRKVN